MNLGSFALLCFVSLCGADYARIPLNKVEKNTLSYLKYAYGPDFIDVRSIFDRRFQMLLNRLDKETFLLPGSIGTPPQPFSLLLDLQNNYLMVYSKECRWLTMSCWTHRRYNGKASTTYVPLDEQISLSYGKSHVKGYLSRDNLILGDIVDKNETFIQILSNPGKYNGWLETFDGVIGLAKSDNDNIKSVLENLLSHASEKKIGILINRFSRTNRGGELTIGGVNNQSYIGRLTAVKNVGLTSWAVPVKRILVGENGSSSDACGGNCTATLSTTSNYISGPPDAVHKIRILLKTDKTDGFFMCNRVSDLPAINIEIEGNKYELKHLDYMVEYNLGLFSICHDGFSADDNLKPGQWIFGTNFLTKWFTVLDLKDNQIQFGLSKHH